MLKKLSLVLVLSLSCVAQTTHKAGMLDLSQTWTGTNTFKNINAVRYADQFASLADAYNDLPATGGTIVLPPGYSTTLSATLNISKPNTTIFCMGNNTISTGTYHIGVVAGTHGVSFDGVTTNGGADHTTGCVITHTSADEAVLVGNTVSTTREFSFRHWSVRITGAGTGLYLHNVVYFEISNSSFTGNGTAGSNGIVMDGRGNYTGNGVIINPVINSVETGIFGTGPWSGSMNAVRIIGGTIQATTYGINIDQGDANYIIGTDIESCTTAIRLGDHAFNNFADYRSEANTNDVAAVAGSAYNTVKARTQNGDAPVVSDAGTNNHFDNGVNGNFDLITGLSGMKPSNSAAPTCDASHRGVFWYQPGAAGVKDVVQVCAKDVADAYAWRPIY